VATIDDKTEEAIATLRRENLMEGNHK